MVLVPLHSRQSHPIQMTENSSGSSDFQNCEKTVKGTKVFFYVMIVQFFPMSMWSRNILEV